MYEGRYKAYGIVSMKTENLINHNGMVAWSSVEDVVEAKKDLLHKGDNYKIVRLKIEVLEEV